jgi:hypothetical protein
MFVTFKPEGQEPQSWDFDPSRVKASICEMIEKRAGEPFEAWAMSIRSGKARARRVLLWHLISRDGHVLKFEDTPDFAFGELTVEHSVFEILNLREQFAKMKFEDPEQKSQLMAALDADLAEAREREGLTEEEDAPKAP